jgi:DNA excision repair protein ERCC-3
LSGAEGAYLEYSTGARGAGGRGYGSGAGSRGGSARPVKPKNSILRERDAMRKGK